MGSLIFLSTSAGSVVRNLATPEASWSDFSFEFIPRIRWTEVRIKEQCSVKGGERVESEMAEVLERISKESSVEELRNRLLRYFMHAGSQWDNQRIHTRRRGLPHVDNLNMILRARVLLFILLHIITPINMNPPPSSFLPTTSDPY